MIQEVKQRFGQEAEHIISRGIGLEKVGKKYRCKNVTAHKNADKNPSMSWDPDALQFYCFTCKEKIDIYGYLREFENLEHKEILYKSGLLSPSDYQTNTNESKDNRILKYNVMPLEKSHIDYLLSRKIDINTQIKYKLGMKDNNITIPYYEYEKLTGIKIRNMGQRKPKYYSEVGSKFGLFNKDNVKETKKLIITEGEFDCMVIVQCGFENVVSVGSGANSLSELFLKQKNYLLGFESIVLLSDNDIHGTRMDSTFIEELDYRVKLPDKKLYLDCIDINDVYVKHGPNQVKKIIESATSKIEGLRNLDRNPYRGIEINNGKYISTGLPSIDIAINDLAPGLVTLITGRSNSGKSTLVNQIMANAIDTKNKVLLMAGEGIQEILINNVYKAIIGRDKDCYEYKKVNRRMFKEPTTQVLKALESWHKGKFTLFNKGDSELKTTDELFKLLNIQVKTERYDLIVIDNLMSVLSVDKATEKLEKQADFMQRCCDLAKSENLHIVLVLHPNKTVTKGSSMDFEQISGTQDLANKADNIIAVTRKYEPELTKIGICGEIEVLKNRYFSDLPKIQVHYDGETGLLLEIDEETGDYIKYIFRWKKFLKEQRTG